MGFPFADWQFWVVTLTAGGAVWALIRPFVGGGEREAGQAPCARCGTSGRTACGHASSGQPKLVTLGGNRKA